MSTMTSADLRAELSELLQQRERLQRDADDGFALSELVAIDERLRRLRRQLATVEGLDNARERQEK